ncbi:Transporter, drug/metabolite exporter family protein [Shewanella benthica]|uniref:Transporter, drug/metabolite exporter family protein n=1 Tax=Shewanella benthica TaxID=43661 RepID=A0A330M7Q2_9GAMM|nr:hypothetical protein [Shewanella benthica]SQH78198.1 Transporter, drug/metabolite exporter family protein [Shewanella benthica]
MDAFQLKQNKAFCVSFARQYDGYDVADVGQGRQVDASQLSFLLAAVLLSIHFVLNKKISSQLTPLVSICLQLFTVGIVGAVLSKDGNRRFNHDSRANLDHDVECHYVG